MIAEAIEGSTTMGHYGKVTAVAALVAILVPQQVIADSKTGGITQGAHVKYATLPVLLDGEKPGDASAGGMTDMSKGSGTITILEEKMADGQLKTRYAMEYKDGPCTKNKSGEIHLTLIFRDKNDKIVEFADKTIPLRRCENNNVHLRGDIYNVLDVVASVSFVLETADTGIDGTEAPKQ